MEEKSFHWTTELAKKMFRLRFKNEELFEKKKQPWEQFYHILLENGFPEEMTVDQVRKKWGYHLDMYRAAKKARKTNVNYYKIFDKYLGQNQVIDKYGSWTDEWRTILIDAITEATEMKLDQQALWMTVENTLRSQELPEDCCIQDIKNLWHHIKTIFARRYRIALKKDDHDTDWPLYGLVLNYYKKNDPQALVAIEHEINQYARIHKKQNGKCINKKRKSVENNAAGETEIEFTWTKDITETLIVAKLQNDWLFKERGQRWRDFTEILKREHGFPDCLTPLHIGRKWATIYSDYQKAKATNNSTWMYYNLFEVHMQSGFCYNPLNQWEEEWVQRLITIRTNLEHHFTCDYFNRTGPRNNGWREVEKKLRAAGIPKSHSLLELREIWSYLRSTFKWKHKFAVKGMLTEHWPYYDAMAIYEAQRSKQNNNISIQKVEKEEIVFDQDNDMSNDEDDMTLIDLKQKLGKPKDECEVKCRACASADTLEHCVDIYDYRDDTGTNLASKLQIVAGIEVDKSDNMTNLICQNCLQELENAYEFRRKCQTTDKMLREEQATKYTYTIKLEVEPMDHDDHTFDDTSHLDEAQITEPKVKDIKKTTVKKEGGQRKRRLKGKPYQYHKMCEVCGKVTKNITAHMDSHAEEKRHTCDICGKKFKFRGALIIHKQLHHMPVTRKETCEVCGKAFRTKAQYKRHFMIHTNERKFECETCGKRFNSTEVLKVHNRMHTDERPFACSECGKRFRTAGCVTRHKRIVHNKIIKKDQ